MRPETKAIGRSAAITVNVARIVGLPTSSTASTAVSGSNLMQLEMPVDVFYHDDRIVHKDTDGKDKGKEGHPVEGIPVEIIDQAA